VKINLSFSSQSVSLNQSLFNVGKGGVCSYDTGTSRWLPKILFITNVHQNKVDIDSKFIYWRYGDISNILMAVFRYCGE